MKSSPKRIPQSKTNDMYKLHKSTQYKTNDKSKIIIFHKRYTSTLHFKLGEQEIEVIDKYKYLGTLIYKSGSFIHAKNTLLNKREGYVSAIYENK